MPTRTRRKRRTSCGTTTTTKTTSGGGTGLKCHLCRLTFKTKANFDDHCEKKHHLVVPNQSEFEDIPLQGNNHGKGKLVEQGTKRKGGDSNRIPPSPSISSSTRSHKRKSAEGSIIVKSSTASSSGDKSKADDDDDDDVDGLSTKSSSSHTGTLDSASVSSSVRELRVRLFRLPEPPKSNPVQDEDETKDKNPRKKGKVYSCPVDECPSVFGEKYKYINHLEIHEGLKPFVCPQCQFGYDDELKLLEHVSVRHTKEAFFDCQKCGSAFKVRRFFKSHKCKQ